LEENWGGVPGGVGVFGCRRLQPDLGVVEPDFQPNGFMKSIKILQTKALGGLVPWPGYLYWRNQSSCSPRLNK
jgi:hypothetical protein